MKLVKMAMTIGGLGAGSFYDITWVRRKQSLDGPLLVIANHPNGGLDPLLVQELVERDLRFLAKSTLFDKPVVKNVLASARALPAYRKQDGQDTAQNTSTFEAVNEAFRNQDAVAIFPEGVSHNETDMVRFKSGPARMALAAYADGVTDLLILPCGLHYFDKERWRSKAIAVTGKAVSLHDWISKTGLEADPENRNTVTKLTELLDVEIRKVTVNAPDRRTLDAAEFISSGNGESLHKTINLVQKLSDKDLGWFDKLSDLQTRLQRVGGVSENLTVIERPIPIRFHVFADALITAGQAPAVALGAWSYGPAFHATHWLYTLVGKKGKGGAGIKIGVGLLIYPNWATVLIWGLRKIGFGAVMSVAVALAGWITHLAARPMLDDMKERWQRNVFSIQMKYSSAKRARMRELREEYAILVDEHDSFTRWG